MATKLDHHFSLGRSAEQGTVTLCKAKRPRGDYQELEMGKGKKLVPCVTSQDSVKALPLARLKKHAAEVEVLPDALGRNKSFCTGS